MSSNLIGEHYWVINGYDAEPPIEEQIAICKEEIQNYKDKQEYAKEAWEQVDWENQEKLYEFWLYKNMEFYWERVLKILSDLPVDNKEPSVTEKNPSYKSSNGF